MNKSVNPGNFYENVDFVRSFVHLYVENSKDLDKDQKMTGMDVRSFEWDEKENKF